MSEPPRSWKDVASQKPVNEMRAEIYRRVMEAEDRIAHVLYARGVSHEVVTAALEAVDERLLEDQRREDLYLSALARYVEALGGRLSLMADFGDELLRVG